MADFALRPSDRGASQSRLQPDTVYRECSEAEGPWSVSATHLQRWLGGLELDRDRLPSISWRSGTIVLWRSKVSAALSRAGLDSLPAPQAVQREPRKKGRRRRVEGQTDRSSSPAWLVWPRQEGLTCSV